MNNHKPVIAVVGVLLLCGSNSVCWAQTSTKGHTTSHRPTRYYYTVTKQQSGLPDTQSSYIQEGSISRTAGGDAAGGGGGGGAPISALPRAILGPAVGQAGDRVSQGFLNGSRSPQSQGSGSVGLPPVRSSPYVDGYGDHIRSDMHMRINGTRWVTPRHTTVQSQPQSHYVAPVATYGSPLSPTYSHSSP